MIQSEIFYKNIRDKLAAFEASLRIDSASNLHDINIFAENIITFIMNKLYGYNLENANGKDGILNSPGFDLKDDKNKIFVQVSSQNSAEKISTNIDTCSKNKNYKNYNFYFVGLFTEKIQDETKTYPYYNKKGIKVYKKNLLNLKSICSQIQKLDLDKLKEIHNYIDKEFTSFSRKKSNKDLKLEKEYLDFLENFFNLCSQDFWLNFTDYINRHFIPNNYFDHYSKIVDFIFSRQFSYKNIFLILYIKKLYFHFQKLNSLLMKMELFDDNCYRENKFWRHVSFPYEKIQEFENNSKIWDRKMYCEMHTITFYLNKLLLLSKHIFTYNQFPKELYLIGDSYGIRNGTVSCKQKAIMTLKYNKKGNLTLITKLILFIKQKQF